jgi:AcrR family transcriptional regulator
MRQSKVATEQTRQALLDAAEQLFWEQGAARTSVQEIARTAGLTRGAFYYHFSDKVAVFEALLARARAADPVLPTVEEHGITDALDTLRAFCTSVYEEFIKDRPRQQLFGIVMQRREALAELEPLASARREEIWRSARAYQCWLEAASRAGRLSPNWTPEIAATTLYSTMIGLLDQWLRTPERFDALTVGLACINQLFDSFERLPTSSRRAHPEG